MGEGLRLRIFGIVCAMLAAPASPLCLTEIQLHDRLLSSQGMGAGREEENLAE